MPQAIANPDDLRAFAAKLKQFNTTLTDQAAMLLSKLDVMSGDLAGSGEHEVLGGVQGTRPPAGKVCRSQQPAHSVSVA